MILTDKNIEELISCEKVITKAPKRHFSLDKTNHFSEQNEFDCQSKINPKNTFHVFLRKSTEISDNFSIGLIFNDEETKNVLLLRANGRQKHRNKEDDKSFYAFHVHKANEKQLMKGILNKFDAEICEEYSNFNSALIYFCQKCGIMNYKKYFPEAMQISMEDL